MRPAVEMGVVFLNEQNFGNKQNFFVKRVSFRKNERWTNEMDRSEKWRYYRFLITKKNRTI